VYSVSLKFFTKYSVDIHYDFRENENLTYCTEPEELRLSAIQVHY
jgi:hypothetical protein